LTDWNLSMVAYLRITDSFVKALASRLEGRRVLEVFAGDGTLAGCLSRLGIRITATSIQSSHDGTADNGFRYPVTMMTASQAVARLGGEADVLLMSWPTVTEDATRAALLWGSDRDIVFIGEMTDYSKGFLGGCATDAFFDATQVVEDLPAYETTNMMERAVILRARPECVDDFRHSGRLPASALESIPGFNI
jgi:hypothetical protein